MNDETIFPSHAYKKKPSFGFLFGAKKPLEGYIILICATSPTVIANIRNFSFITAFAAFFLSLALSFSLHREYDRQHNPARSGGTIWACSEFVYLSPNTKTNVRSGLRWRNVCISGSRWWVQFSFPALIP